ncbi:MAG: ABC transporter substrate-binding protein [Candidatus Marinimicrobia bacterium]|nr:ABC transporter substrate-binding protein [Candidatus Neomarinimicrobiota bacterium]MCF7880147.1 ABC transporter substrate-binding protein [Candidatus Neomarinimicrobiota bacterium]
MTFWHSFVSATRPALDTLVHEFEQSHPHISLEPQYIQTGDALAYKLLSTIQSGTTPDIAWVHSDFLNKLAASGRIYPIRELADEYGSGEQQLFGDIREGLLTSASWNDTLYALPMEASTLALVYNESLLRKAGLPPKPPETWAELKEYTARLSLDKNEDGILERYGFYVPVFTASGPLNMWMIMQWMPFYWQAGGQEVNADETKVLFDSPPGIQALAFWKELWEMQNFTQFSLSHDNGFVSQTVAMVIDGPWNLPTYRKIDEFHWNIAPLPSGPAGDFTYLGGEHLAVFRSTEHPDAAWEFLSWVTQPEVQARFAMNSGYLPVSKQALHLPEFQEFLEQDPQYAGFVKLLGNARVRHRFDRSWMEVNRLLGEAIERSVIGEKSPEKVLRQSVRKINTELLAGEK